LAIHPESYNKFAICFSIIRECPREMIDTGMQPAKVIKLAAAWAAVVVLTIAIGVTVAAAFYWKSLKEKNLLPKDEISQKILWRARLYARKATGDIPDLTWSDLWEMTRARGGFGLEALVVGVSKDSIQNPYNSQDDHNAGARIFGQRCAKCHGIDGEGANGPRLNSPGLKHGESNLAIYKVLRDGIPGTAMVSPDLTPVERWRVIGYLTHLMVHGSDRDVLANTHLSINVSSERIRSAGSRPDEWLTYSGSLDGRHYTPLTEINNANVSHLRLLWIQQFDNIDPTVEATPLVVDGTIFITEPPSNVVALDAKTGDVIWKYDRTVASDLSLCCGRKNRGVAVLGQSVFLASLDGYLVSINANTGKMNWETRVADATGGYSMTGAPLIVNQSVVVGVAGGDYEIRGFLAAYDPATGQQQWKFNTIPGPGEPGHETWKSDRWRNGGGPTWVTGSYDPTLDLLYWGVGNPAGDYSGEDRPGDNLFTDSVIALHPSTGKLEWYFQFTPHDEHDWDAAQTPILTEVSIKGTKRKVICWANRNGFYYVLDRVTGEFLTGVPFVEQNWAKDLDSNGRPIPSDADLGTGRLVKPFSGGGTNFQNAALDQAKGLIFVHATEGASLYTKALNVRQSKERNLLLSSSASSLEPPTLFVRALDVATGARKWEHLSPPIQKNLSYSYSGLLATGGGLVLGASGGYAFALDSATGHELWRVFLGGDTRAAPISFAVDGRQVIALSAGRSLFLFGL
jgi:alcohol dehydrogenase (cytochrome c)